MKSMLILTDRRHVNLASAISPELYAELEGTQGRGTRKNPLLFCGNCGGGIYIKHGSTRRDQLYGAHFDAGTCTADLTIRKSIMSDEHKRMAEYHAAAASAEGLDADFEVVTSARTRVDVVVDGRIGIEVQRSKLTAGAAVQRTARSMSSGLETVAWCAELESAAWNGRSPATSGSTTARYSGKCRAPAPSGPAGCSRSGQDVRGAAAGNRSRNR